MANEDYLSLLKQGAEVWNEWRKENKQIVPDLSGANLSEFHLNKVNFSGTILTKANLWEAALMDADLSEADLTCADLGATALNIANLRAAKLRGANLNEAILFRTDLRNSDLRGAILSRSKLTEVDLSGMNLEEVDLRESSLDKVDFRGTNLSRSNLSGVDLRKANLYHANLGKANLSDTNLSDVNLNGANLTDANLSRVQALGTDFTAVELTGACLQDWNINSSTKLDDIDCKFVYLKCTWDTSNQTLLAGERCPSVGEFSDGEFTRLFQKAFSFIDLIFRDGIDWQAFAYTFEKIKLQNEHADLAIQSIENRGDGVIVIRVNVSPAIDKAYIYTSFSQNYEFVSKILQERYQAELEGKSEEIRTQREVINNLFILLNQQAGVQKLMAENPKVNQSFNIHAPINTFSGYTETFYNFSPEQRQNLAEAAAEIQQLLNQLSESNSNDNAVITEKIYYEIKQNPTLKARLTNALKAGGVEALKAIFNHPLINIPVETIKGWLEAE